MLSSCTRSLLHPTAVPIRDVQYVLYGPTLGMKLPLHDPWSSTSPQHIKAYDIPELDLLFTTAAPVSVPERLAAMAGYGAADPAAAHVSPTARAYTAAQLESAHASGSGACEHADADCDKRTQAGSNSNADSFIASEGDSVSASAHVSDDEDSTQDASTEVSGPDGSESSVPGPIRGGAGAHADALPVAFLAPASCV